MEEFLTYNQIKSNENCFEPIAIEVLGSEIFEKTLLYVDAIGMPINFKIIPNFEFVN